VKTNTAFLSLAVVAGLGLEASACKKVSSLLGIQEPIVDQDYQFRLESPGRRWKLLGEPEARRLVPDAIAGASLTGTGTKSQFAAIIVERYSGDLDSYVQLLMDSSTLEDKKLESRETLEFQRHSAVRTTMRGSFNGLKVIFQHLIFLNRGHGYQIVSWGLDGQVDAKSLGTAANAFKLLDGPVRGRQRPGAVADARGPGWRAKDGVFRSAAWGFEVAPGAGSRIVVGSELASMNASAEVGVISSRPDTYLIVLPECIAGAEAGALAQARLRDNAKTMGLVPEEGGFSGTIAGETVPMQRYRSKTQPIVYYQGTLVRGDVLLVLIGWHIKMAHDDSGGGALADGMGAIRFLAPDARKTLADELAALPDAQNAVGASYSLRHGTYRDFANHLTWKMPPGALRLHVGAAARAVQPTALAFVEEVGTGIGALLLRDSSNGMDGASYHAAITGGRYEKKGRTPKPRPYPVGGGAAGMTTVGQATIAGVQMIEQTVSWVDKDRATQVLMWGPRPSATQALARFEQLLQGLTVAPITAIAGHDQTYADRRIGYSYKAPDLPGGPWVRNDVTAKEIAAIGTTIEWRNARYKISILGLYALDSRLDEEGFVSKFKPSSGLPLLSSAAITSDTLDGVAGKRLKGSKEDIVAIRRDGTFFGLVMDALSGSLEDTDVAAMKAGFHVLD
jgi:hypothetical protein